MNIRQLPWYQDKKTQQAELYNNKNPSQQVDTTPNLSPPGGRGKKIQTKNSIPKIKMNAYVEDVRKH